MINVMEGLLMIEAEAKSLFSGKNRPYERELKKLMFRMIEDAEFLFGPRDRSFELLEPRIAETSIATPVVYPFRKIRIFLTPHAKIARYTAAYELSHEVVHVLSPLSFDEAPTVLEEGLATYFSFKSVKRIYGVQYETTGWRHYDAAFRAVSTLLAKNEFLIKELRVHQPVISRIDVKLLVEVAGIDVDLAKFLCLDFIKYSRPTMSWTARATENAQLFARGAQAIWEQWSSVSKAAK